MKSSLKNLFANAPTWAKWAAKDKPPSGRTCYFKDRPIRDADSWMPNEAAGQLGSSWWLAPSGVTIPGPWRSSLRKRPSPTPRKAGKRVRAWAFYSCDPRGSEHGQHVKVFLTRKQAIASRASELSCNEMSGHDFYNPARIVEISLPLPARKSRKGGGK